MAKLNLENGTGTVQELSQAVATHDQFCVLVELLLAGPDAPCAGRNGILGREQKLRALIGAKPNQKRLICPVDVPEKGELNLSLSDAIAIAVVSNPELNTKRNRVAKCEVELAIGKTRLSMDATSNLPREDIVVERIMSDHPALPHPFLIPPAVPIVEIRERAKLRGNELRLEREKSKLADDTRILTELLENAFSKTNTQYHLAQTAMQRWKVSETEVKARSAEFKNGRTPVNTVLQSQQRRMEATVDYYDALAKYTKSRSYIDYLSGTTLAKQNISLSRVFWDNVSPKTIE